MNVSVAIAVFSGALLATLWTVVEWRVRFEERQTIADAHKQNRNLVTAYEEHTARTIKGIDQLTHWLAQVAGAHQLKVDLPKYTGTGLIDSQLSPIIGVYDEQGNSVANSVKFKPMNNADREYFQAHAREDTGRLYIGKPLQGRLTGRWVIPMSRRINKPDGSFGGVLLASVDPAYFTQFHAQVDIGANSVIEIVGLDGISLVRTANTKSDFGRDLRTGTLMREQAKVPSGSYLSLGKLEGTPRFMSYRTLQDYPLVIAVGTSKNEVLAEFVQRRNRYYWVTAMVSACIALFAAALLTTLSRQRRTFSALAASEELMRATFDHAEIGIVHTTGDGRHLRVNQKFCDMVGYARDELLGMTAMDVTHPEDRGLDAARRAGLIAGELATYSVQRRCVRKDGAVIWVNRTVSAVRDDAGKLLYFIRVIEDITARKEEEERFKATFDEAPVGIAHTAPDARLLQANRKFCEMLGYTRAEIIGMPVAALIHPDHVEAAIEERRALESGAVKACSREHLYFKKDGTPVWANRNMSIVRDAAGQPKYYISVAEDITERKQMEERLLHLAHYDNLTQLPNRVLFYDRLKHALSLAQRRKWITAVMFVDLDRFKMVNDTLGHLAGDRLLQLVAERLSTCVRADDTVSRLGGDEFAVILSDVAKAQDTALVAQKILDTLSEPFELDGNEAFVTASIGISVYPGDSTDADSLINNADVAMYRAKELGKNNYQFYTTALNERALDKLHIENDLRGALARDEFLLHFQPKASLASGEITGFEALLRWRRRGEGLTSPAEFIPLLEESGLIVPVGEWVLRAACGQIRAWREMGVTPVPIAVNLSAKQFQRQDICAVVRRVLFEHAIEPRLLELEITESAAMENTEETIAALHALKALGVRISMDDFGTGYSSLSYLKRLPVDCLKIDRSFVTDLVTNPDDASIAQAVITMAHSLHMKVIAEGVETAAQLAFLAANCCDEMQGYYFSRPLPALECTALLRQGRKLPRPALAAAA